MSRPEHRPEAANTVRQVTRLLTRSGQVLDLWVQGRRIETTNEHPYWVVGKGWKTANTLQVGDIFLTSDNRQVVLERIEDRNRYVAVYNLEVEADHTYFVGDANWGFDVWSHNHDETTSIYKAPQPGKAQQQLKDGYKPKDFADGDKKAYFAKEKTLADKYAAEYGEGVIEVKVPKKVYDSRLKKHEEPYEGGPHTQILVPHEDFDALNRAERILHAPN